MKTDPRIFFRQILRVAHGVVLRLCGRGTVSNKINVSNVDSDLLEDRPIVRAEDDLLGRGPFVASISSAIRAFRGRDSLVIGICGDWGSGKSSVVNLLIEHLQTDGVKAPDVIHFNPWQWSSQESIAKAFFGQIEVFLYGKSKSTNAKAIAKKLRRLSGYLGLAAQLSSGFKGIFGLLASALSIGLMLGVTFGFLPVISLVGSLVWTIVAALLLWSESFAAKAASLFEIVASGSDLEDIRTDLHRELRKCDRPLLVIIDDIDRLTAAEVRHLFATVKSNADFPNCIYLLLFQRSIVEKHLESIVEGNGAEYLAKIVNMPFDIPTVSRKQIQLVLESGVDRILNRLSIKDKFDKDHWYNTYVDGVREYFGNLRDVKRFLLSLDFLGGAFVNGRVFEVNPVDLIGLECLRLFESNLYRRLAANKELLTGMLGRDTIVGLDPKRGKAMVDALLDNVDDRHKVHAKQIMRSLFPTVDNFADGYRHEYTNHDQWAQLSRVCHNDYFDRYFHFTLGDDEISDGEIEEAISTSSDYDQFLKSLRTEIDKHRIHELLEKLNARRELIPISNTSSYLRGLCDCGDVTSEEALGLSGISAFQYLGSLFDAHARRIVPYEQRFQAIREAFESCNGIDLPIYILSFEIPSGKSGKPDDSLLNNEGDVNILIGILKSKIETKSLDGSLINVSHILVAIDRWMEWGGKDQAQEYVRRLAGTPQGATCLVTAAISRRIVHPGGRPRIEWATDLNHLFGYADMNALNDSISTVDAKALGVRERRGVEVYKRSLEFRLAGKSIEESFAEWHSVD